MGSNFSRFQINKFLRAPLGKASCRIRLCCGDNFLAGEVVWEGFLLLPWRESTSIFSESDCLVSKSSSLTWIASRFRRGLLGRLSSVEGPHDTRPLPFFPFPLPLLHSSGTAKIMFFSGFKGEMVPCFLIFACLTMKRSSAGSSLSSSKCSCNWSLSSVRSARKIHAEPPRCLCLDRMSMSCNPICFRVSVTFSRSQRWGTE